MFQKFETMYHLFVTICCVVLAAFALGVALELLLEGFVYYGVSSLTLFVTLLVLAYHHWKKDIEKYSR